MGTGYDDQHARYIRSGVLETGGMPRARVSDDANMCVVWIESLLGPMRSVLLFECKRNHTLPTDSVCVTLLSSNCSILRSGGEQ